MKNEIVKKGVGIMLATVMAMSLFTGCGGDTKSSTEIGGTTLTATDDSKVLNVAMNADITTMDVQKTSSDYMVPLNIYDRLFEINLKDDGSTELQNSLCEDYSVSDDGLVYTFKLRKGVKFSNGEDLTASDVLYTFVRNLTVDQGVNYDFMNVILGADDLYNGKTNELEGFEIVDDYDFKVTLSQPFGGFVYQLASPACSIYDETSTEEAGDQFGIDTSVTVGSGPYMVDSWKVNSSIVLVKNPNYWGDAPSAEQVNISIIPDANTLNMAFQNGKIDIIDLDSVDSSIVESTYKTQYKDQMVSANRVATSYLALNEDVKPLDDVKVRKAIQMAINRQEILDSVYGGDGNVEDMIFPKGLIAHNDDLEDTIKYDPDGAKELLKEAGYPDGFEMELSFDSSSTDSTSMVYQIIQKQLEEVGIKVNIASYDQSSWLDLRKSGKMNSFVATWTADYNDPDNFIYTFFGDVDKTTQRSLNYKDKEVMKRINDARGIVDETERINEYQDLEKKIVLEDAAWVPLYSTKHYFAIGDKVEKFVPFWSGYSDSEFRNVTLK